MNIFKKFNENKPTTGKLPTEPNELFYRLKKEKDYSYLRGIQEEALTNWNDRRSESHLLVKMNTGAGKTLVGLLMLYSKQLETGGRSLYLCPDRQLVSQVFEQSKNYNIPTCIIEGDSEFPEEFLNGKAILITTVHRLFNGKNIFDKYKIDVNSIVIDDAHRCVEKVKDNFCIKIPKGHSLYQELFDYFGEELKRQALGAYEAIRTEEPSFYMKLPFWSWIESKGQVFRLFSRYIKDKETLFFKWDLFRNNYEQYEFFISSSRIEISPMKCFAENITTYTEARHIYALSATFENDTALLYDLDFTEDSILNPIEPKDRQDYGQRLILTPKRYFNDFDAPEMQQVIMHHLGNGENVMVLVPTYAQAEVWKNLGAELISENIEDEIAKLRTSAGNFIVLVNRYDGIDLGGDACKVLIIYDHPRYKYLKDEYVENILHITNANIIAQTVEQGMGRTVRSSNDYSVVYLLGRSILRFLRYRENFKFLNTHTRRQIEMGLDLLSPEALEDEKSPVEAICETADYCLAQNDEWLTYYTDFMNREEAGSLDDDKEVRLKRKAKERLAILDFIRGKNEEAAQRIREILSEDLSRFEMAIYYQLCANFTYSIDKNISNDLILKSREQSSNMFEPFLSQQLTKQHLKSEKQFVAALGYLNSFSTMNDAINAFTEVFNDLIYRYEGDANKFEEAVKSLGRILGFKSTRPEKEQNEGPDNLWVMDGDLCLIIEAKSGKHPNNHISKGEISQLMHSVNWFENRYVLNEGVEYLGVSMHPNRQRESDAEVNDRLRVIDSSSLDSLRKSLRAYIDFLSKHRLGELNIDMIRTELMAQNLNSSGFSKTYLKRIL